MVGLVKRVFTRLFRTELTECRCSSRVADRTVELAQEYAAEADELRLALTVKWPLLLLRLKTPALLVELANATGLPLGDPTAYRVEQDSSRRTTHLQIVVAGPTCQGESSIRVTIRRAKDRVVVGHWACHRLTVESVAHELRIRRCEWFASQQSKCVATEVLHDEVQEAGFTIVLDLPAPEHATFLQQLGLGISVELSAEDQSQVPFRRWHKPLRFYGGRFSWRQRLGPAAEIFPRRLGKFHVSFRLGHCSLSTKTLLLKSRSAYLAEAYHEARQRLIVSGVTLSAVDHRGVTRLAGIVAEDFQELVLAARPNLPQLAALLTEIELSAIILLRSLRTGTVLRQEQRPIALRRGFQELVLHLPLAADVFDSGPGRYSVALLLDDRLLSEAEFVHKTRAQLRREKAEAILQTITLQDLRLVVLREGGRVETDHVFETDQAICPAFACQGQGFDEDAPALKWRLAVKIYNLETGACVRFCHWLQAREGPNRCEDLELPIPPGSQRLPPGRYHLQLFKRKQLLAECPFRILSAAEAVQYTANRVIDGLRLLHIRLLLQADGFRYEDPNVPVTTDALWPELAISASGFNAQLPRLHTTLRLQCRGPGARQRELAALPVTLAEGQLDIREIAIPLAGSSLAQNPSARELVLSVGNREITAVPFRLVTEAEVLRQLEVRALSLDAEYSSGRWLLDVAELEPRNLRSIRIGFRLHAGIRAPNQEVMGKAILWLDGGLLGHAEFSSCLAISELQVRCHPIHWDSLAISFQPRQLAVEVQVGEHCRSTRSFAFVSSTITDFEGQLRVDPRTLRVDEEYEAIRSRL